MKRLAQYLKAKAAWPRRVELPFKEAMEQTGPILAKESGAIVSCDTLHWMDLAAPLIERFEGMARLIPGDRVTAYPDPGTGDKPWTIGIGSTTNEDGYPIAPGTVWTVERARKRFRSQLEEFGREVDKLLDGAPTTPAQKAALTSLAYNVGSHALGRSTALRMHKRGEHEAAADAFLMWNKAGGRVMRGLVRRREAERELYLS